MMKFPRSEVVRVGILITRIHSLSVQHDEQTLIRPVPKESSVVQAASDV
jgi:hypothetical protein